MSSMCLAARWGGSAHPNLTLFFFLLIWVLDRLLFFCPHFEDCKQLMSHENQSVSNHILASRLWQSDMPHSRLSVRLIVGQLRQPHQCRCQLNDKTFKVKSNISFERWLLWYLQTTWLFLLLNWIAAKLLLWKCDLHFPTLLCRYLFSDFCSPALVALSLCCWLTLDQCTEGPAADWPGTSWEDSSFKTQRIPSSVACLISISLCLSGQSLTKKK